MKDGADQELQVGNYIRFRGGPPDLIGKVLEISKFGWILVRYIGQPNHTPWSIPPEKVIKCIDEDATLSILRNKK